MVALFDSSIADRPTTHFLFDSLYWYSGTQLRCPFRHSFAKKTRICSNDISFTQAKACIEYASSYGTWLTEIGLQMGTQGLSDFTNGLSFEESMRLFTQVAQDAFTAKVRIQTH